MIEASRIVPGLWQGSRPLPGAGLPFDYIVLAAKEWQFPEKAFPFGRRVHVMRVPLDDSGKPMTRDEQTRALHAAAFLAKWHDKARVLVTCAQERNRSGLICALTLVALGVSAEDAISLVRRGSGPSALSNRYFVDFIRSSASSLSWAS
jgi:hypothetical protein